MEWTAIEENWTQLSAKMKKKWSALTEDDLKYVDKNKDALVTKVHQRTGLERDTVERQLTALISKIQPAGPAPQKLAPPSIMSK